MYFEMLSRFCGIITDDRANRPDIHCLASLCDKHVTILHRKDTRNRKTIYKVFATDSAVIRKIASPYHWKSVHGIYFTDVLYKSDDPLFTIAHEKDLTEVGDIVAKLAARPDPTVKKFGLNYVISTNDEAVPLIRRQSVPTNAALVSIDPPVWIQFGKGKVLITRGALWLDEDIEEHKSDWLVIQRDNDHYKVLLRDPMKFGVQLGEFFPTGIAEFYPDDTPFGGKIYSCTPSARELIDEKTLSVVLLDITTVSNVRVISLKGDKLLQRDTSFARNTATIEMPASLVTKRYVYLENNQAYYVPKYYVQGW